jgi:hypothetical protein
LDRPAPPGSDFGVESDLSREPKPRRFPSSFRRLSAVRSHAVLKIQSMLNSSPSGTAQPDGLPHTITSVSLPPETLDTIWNSNALSEADVSWLPPNYAIEDALAKLHLTFKKVPRPKTTPQSWSSKKNSEDKGDEPQARSMLIYCPLEGGEVILLCLASSYNNH